jgi:hypothetical protein
MTVDEFVETKVLPEYRDIVTALRTLMKECAPGASEVISYGIPAYKGRRILAVISPTKKGITFAFSRGAEFEDEFGLLEGVGKVSKNVRIRRLEDLNEAALRYYIKQALEIDAGKGQRSNSVLPQQGDPMSKVIDGEGFARDLLDALDETFETHHGIYLDKGTSLFETLETIDAAEASRPVGGKCASIAAQVAHVTFYLEVLERTMLGTGTGSVDWGEIWRTVREVTPEEWAGLQRQLRQTYQRVVTMLRGLDTWEGETIPGGALAIVVHTAYHLGEIRQALCTLK